MEICHSLIHFWMLVIACGSAHISWEPVTRIHQSEQPEMNGLFGVVAFLETNVDADQPHSEIEIACSQLDCCLDGTSDCDHAWQLPDFERT